MSVIFPKTIEYLRSFYLSRKENYKSAAKDFKPYNNYSNDYGYSNVKETHRL